MIRSDITELYFIAPIANVTSILKYGILSNSRSSRLPHCSVAMQDIQTRRKSKKIPGAGWLHNYANLYFDAHNPMLSKLRSQNQEICILRIDVTVLDLPGVIIADCNAASDYVRFYPVTDGLSNIDKDKLFAKYWTHPDNLYEEWEHKSIKCAEVLVPDRVESTYITGAYVANSEAMSSFEQLGIKLPVCVKNDIFF